MPPDAIDDLVDWQMSNPPPPTQHACGVCHTLWTGAETCPTCNPLKTLQANTPAQRKEISMNTYSWLKDAVERAIKTFAQTAVTVLGADAVNVLHVDWLTIVGLGGGAAVVSLLTSVASMPFGDKGSASVVSNTTQG